MIVLLLYTLVTAAFLTGAGVMLFLGFVALVLGVVKLLPEEPTGREWPYGPGNDPTFWKKF